MAGRRLTMAAFLTAVGYFGTDVYYELIREGFHFHVIYAKAEKAARNGYTEYGVAPDRPWLTDKGRAFLADADVRPTGAVMDTVWLLQDDTDYYGPDFEAVFATREAAETYMAKQERSRRHKPFWMLTEEPVYTIDMQPSEQ